MDFLNKLLGTPAKKTPPEKSKQNAGPVKPGVVQAPPPPPPSAPEECAAPSGALASPDCSVAFVREFVEEIVDNASVLSEDDQSQCDVWSELSYDTASVGVTASVSGEQLVTAASTTQPRNKHSDTDSDSISFRSAEELPAPVNKNLVIAESHNNSFGLTDVINKLENFHIKTPGVQKPVFSIDGQIFTKGEGKFAADDSDLDTSSDLYVDSENEHQVTVLVDDKPCSVSFSSCDDNENTGEQTPVVYNLSEEQLVAQALLELEHVVQLSEKQLPKECVEEKVEISSAESVSTESKPNKEEVPETLTSIQDFDEIPIKASGVYIEEPEAFVIVDDSLVASATFESPAAPILEFVNLEISPAEKSPAKVEAPNKTVTVETPEVVEISPAKLETPNLTTAVETPEVVEILPAKLEIPNLTTTVETPEFVEISPAKLETPNLTTAVETPEVVEILLVDNSPAKLETPAAPKLETINLEISPVKVDTTSEVPKLESINFELPSAEKSPAKVETPEVPKLDSIDFEISPAEKSPAKVDTTSEVPKLESIDFEISPAKVETTSEVPKLESINFELPSAEKSPVKVETTKLPEAPVESAPSEVKTNADAALSDLLSRCEQQQKALDCLAEDLPNQKEDKTEEDNLEALLASEAERVCEEIHNASVIFDAGDMSDTLDAPCAPPRKSVSPRRTASPFEGGDCEDPFKPKSRIASSPPREGTSPGASMTSSSDSAVAMSSSGKLQREPSSESAGSPKSIPSMDSGICGADVNHSEAGPDIASQEVFVSSEIFKDPNAFEFLSTLGSRGGASNVSCSRLERESLYVKFDPLVAARDRKVYLSPCLETSRGSDAGDSPHPAPRQEANCVVENHSDKATPPGGAVGTLVNLGTPTPPNRAAREHQDTPKNVASRGHDVKEGSPGPTMQQVGFAQELLDRQARVFEERLARLAEQHEQQLAAQLAAQRARQEEEAETTRRETARLTKQLATMAAAETQMSLVVKEYEDTISRILVDKEHAKEEWARERASLETERNQAQADLSGAELAFTDLHQKYERAKVAIQGFKSNETELRQSNLRFQEKIQQSHDMYKKLKEHAEAKLAEASQENDEVVRAKEMEAAASNAQIKQLKARIKSLEETLAMREKENQELINICDELVAKVGHP